MYYIYIYDCSYRITYLEFFVGCLETEILEGKVLAWPPAILFCLDTSSAELALDDLRGEGGRKGGRKRGREGEKEGGGERKREGGSEGEKEGGREGEKEGGRERGREKQGQGRDEKRREAGKERETYMYN